MLTRLCIAVLLSILIITAGCTTAGPAPDFVVAPSGNDTNPGTPDQPFATLDRARKAVQGLKKPDNRPIVVMLRGGTYYLSDTVTFTPDDSGTAAAPIVYCAWPGETPVISGGVSLPVSPAADRKQWSTNLPEVRSGKWNFIQLFVDGQRRLRPRLPKNAYFHIEKAAPPTTDPKKGKGDDRFQFKPGQIRSDWTNLHDVEIISFHPWFISRLPIESVDTEKNIVTLTGRTRTEAYFGKLSAGLRYIVENVREAIGPGEWYLDRKTGDLTYMGDPREVIAPRLEKLLVLKGDPAGKAVEHILFRGLTFAHSNWTTSPDGDSQSQAAVATSGAIYATHARKITFENCTLTHLGGYGIELSVGCQDNRIEGCRMTDLGAGGVRIGVASLQSGNNLVSRNTVRDNLIAHACRLHAGAVGIWIGHADHTLVEHNDIYDLYYTGISAGWVWGYKPSGAHNNTIRLNHIHTIGQSVLSDMGGIYTLGVSPGTTLTLNHIHDISRVNYGGWGIYYDEGSSQIISENNLVYRTHDGGFHQHFGEENVFRNNILGPSRGGQFTATRVTTGVSSTTIQEKKAFTFQHNIIYGWAGPKPDAYPWRDLMLKPPRDLYTLSHNLYWNDGNEVKIPARDKDSLAADPLFENPAHGDFRLKPNSPAEKIGFKPFDIRPAGRLTREPPDLDPVRWPRTFPPANPPKGP